MTDRFHTLTVVLEKDTREDDAKHLIDAISQLRGVCSVRGEVANVETHMAEQRAKHELGRRVMACIYDKKD